MRKITLSTVSVAAMAAGAILLAPLAGATVPIKYSSSPSEDRDQSDHAPAPTTTAMKPPSALSGLHHNA